MLDNITEFIPEILTELEQYSDVSIEKLDGNNAQILILNKIPEIINYYEDGTKEEFYTKNAYFGTLSIPYDENRGISPKDIYVQVRIEATLSVYEVGPAKIEHYRLITGSGGLLNCVENGYRNLVITPKVAGGYENPDGSRGSTSWLMYPRTIASPNIGTMYSQSTNNKNYYSSGGGSAVQVDVSIEWRHGTEWGNKSNFSLSICKL